MGQPRDGVLHLAADSEDVPPDPDLPHLQANASLQRPEDPGAHHQGQRQGAAAPNHVPLHLRADLRLPDVLRRERGRTPRERLQKHSDRLLVGCGDDDDHRLRRSISEDGHGILCWRHLCRGWCPRSGSSGSGHSE